MGTSDPHMLHYLQKRRQHLYCRIFTGKELTRHTVLRPTLQMQTPRCLQPQKQDFCSHKNSEEDKAAVNSTSIF